jgi:hypothetical protein
MQLWIKNIKIFDNSDFDVAGLKPYFAFDHNSVLKDGVYMRGYMITLSEVINIDKGGISSIPKVTPLSRPRLWRGCTNVVIIIRNIMKNACITLFQFSPIP